MTPSSSIYHALRAEAVELDIEHTRNCIGRLGCGRDTGCLIQSSAVCAHSSTRGYPAVGYALAYLASFGSICLNGFPSGSLSDLRVILVSLDRNIPTSF